MVEAGRRCCDGAGPAQWPPALLSTGTSSRGSRGAQWHLWPILSSTNTDLLPIFVPISQSKEGAVGLDKGTFVLAWPMSSDKSEPVANNSFPISGPTKNKLGRETPMRTKHA